MNEWINNCDTSRTKTTTNFKGDTINMEKKEEKDESQQSSQEATQGKEKTKEVTDTDIFIKLTKMETKMMKEKLSIAAILPTREEQGD
jgi:hypothetical protein